MVLDEQNRQVVLVANRPDISGEFIDFAVGQTAGWFVEHQQLWIPDQGSSEFDALERAERKARSRVERMLMKVEFIERGVSLLSKHLFFGLVAELEYRLDKTSVGVCMPTNHDVFKHCHTWP